MFRSHHSNQPTSKSLLFRLWLAGTCAALFCVGAAVAAQFEGTYRVPTQWGDMTLTINQNGNEVSGKLLGYDGRVYRVEGNADDEFADGLVYGPAGNSEFELYFDEDDETWYLDLEPVGSNGYQSAEFAALKVSNTGTEQIATEPATPTEAEVLRDSRLVGTWAYQEVMTGGGQSVATRMVMRFLPNGLFVQGDSHSVASGADYGLSSGPGIGAQTGFWQARDGQLQASLDGITFVPLAAYEVRGSSLLLRYYDGTQQLWSRIS